jgi:hypothetical protein
MVVIEGKLRSLMFGISGILYWFFLDKETLGSRTVQSFLQISTTSKPSSF